MFQKCPLQNRAVLDPRAQILQTLGQTLGLQTGLKLDQVVPVNKICF